MSTRRVPTPKHVWLCVAATAALMSLAAPCAVAQVACGGSLGPRGTTTLTSDVGPCDGVAAAITVDSATLDLGGRTVTCADGNGDGDVPDGIVLLGKKARLRNGTVVGCRFGVALLGTGKHRVEGVTSRGNVQDGINVVSSKNKVSGNTTPDNDDGIQVDGDKNKLTSNVANDNREDGIDILNADKNKLTGNTASGNADEGFEITGTKNKLTANTAIGNFSNGIDVDGVKNRIIRNTATGTINGPDIIDTAPCGSNVWRRNTFGTRAPSCIQ